MHKQETVHHFLIDRHDDTGIGKKIVVYVATCFLAKLDCVVGFFQFKNLTNFDFNNKF